MEASLQCQSHRRCTISPITALHAASLRHHSPRRAVFQHAPAVHPGVPHIGVNPAGDAGDTSPPNLFVGGTSTGISPILLRTFGYSRPVLVAQTLPTERPKGVGCGKGCSPPTPHPIRWFVPPTLNSRRRHCFRGSMLNQLVAATGKTGVKKTLNSGTDVATR